MVIYTNYYIQINEIHSYTKEYPYLSITLTATKELLSAPV
jgi:hypothetical protein